MEKDLETVIRFGDCVTQILTWTRCSGEFFQIYMYFLLFCREQLFRPNHNYIEAKTKAHRDDMTYPW